MKATHTGTNSNDIFGSSYVSGNLSRMATSPPTTALQRSKSTDKTKKLLPPEFEPTEYSVICGNKRAFFNSVGNRRFRVICQMHLPEFMNAPTKHEKSIVVTKVMKTLKDACPVGTFVSFEKGRWWEVSDRTSREKIGTFFRDCLSGTYKSSSKNKIAQRKKKRFSMQESPSSSPVPSMEPMTATVLPGPTTSVPAASVPMQMSLNTAPMNIGPMSTNTAPIMNTSVFPAASNAFIPTMASLPNMNTAPIHTASALPAATNPMLPRMDIAQLLAASVLAGTTNPLAAANANMAGMNTAPIINAPLPLQNLRNSIRVPGPSSSRDNDEDSMGSSCGSFYDVNDLTPTSL